MIITATFNIKPLWDAYGDLACPRLIELAVEGHLSFIEESVRDHTPINREEFYAAWYIQVVEDERLNYVVDGEGQVVASYYELLMEMMDYCYTHLYDGTRLVLREIWKTHTVRRLRITAMTDKIAYVAFHVNALISNHEVSHAVHPNCQPQSVHAM